MKEKFNMHVDVDSFLPASEEEKAYMVQMRPSSTFFKDGMKRLLKNKVATVSMCIILFITLASIVIPMFWPYSYETMFHYLRSGMVSLDRDSVDKLENYCLAYGIKGKKAWTNLFCLGTKDKKSSQILKQEEIIFFLH